MSRDPLMALVEARGRELSERGDALGRWIAAGEGGATASAQLGLLADEMAWLKRLSTALELDAIDERTRRLADEVGVPW